MSRVPLQLCLSLLCFFCLVEDAASARILVFYPMTTKSVTQFKGAYAAGLADAGHEVTLVTPYPTPTKYRAKIHREIVVSKMQTVMESYSEQIWEMAGSTESQYIPEVLQMCMFLWDMNGPESNKWFTSIMDETAELQPILNGEITFDLVVATSFMGEHIAGYVSRFQVPLILFAPWALPTTTAWLTGFPQPNSFVPTTMLAYTDKMNFWERVGNTIMITMENLNYEYRYLPFLQKKLGDPSPSVETVLKNHSLVLSYTIPGYGYPRPLLPSVVEVGGMHLNLDPPKPLPADIASHIGNQRFIYFSLGSFLQARHMSDTFRNAFNEAFSQIGDIPVLWKWEEDTLDGAPKNVRLSKWMPQQDTLANPNCALFITHGGLLSTTEAALLGVPVIALPLAVDQKINALTAQNAGVGLALDWADFSAEILVKAIKTILQDQSYRKNQQKVSAVIKDQLKYENPIKKAVYWTEYVLKHDGAVNLRSAAKDMNTIALNNLDVWAVFLLFLYLFVYVTYLAVRRLFSSSSKQPKKQKRA